MGTSCCGLAYWIRSNFGSILTGLMLLLLHAQSPISVRHGSSTLHVAYRENACRSPYTNSTTPSHSRLGVTTRDSED